MAHTRWREYSLTKVRHANAVGRGRGCRVTVRFFVPRRKPQGCPSEGTQELHANANSATELRFSSVPGVMNALGFRSRRMRRWTPSVSDEVAKSGMADLIRCALVPTGFHSRDDILPRRFRRPIEWRMNLIGRFSILHSHRRNGRSVSSPLPIWKNTLSVLAGDSSPF